MPNHENVLQGAQSAPRADVLPTKQASNVSTDDIPSATIPTKAAREEPQYEWKRLTRKAIMRREFSHEPELFLVELHIKSDYRIHGDVREVVYERLYEEFHPYLAIGKAVVETVMEIISPQIEKIHIYRKRIIKK